MDKLKLVEQTLINEDIPDFEAGDTVNVHYRVREGDKERIQQFEGVVISRRGSGSNETFIVRKISAGNIGVERIFPIHSPFIAKVEVKKEGDVRRSKLYYLRNRRGKAARIKEKDRRPAGAAAAASQKDGQKAQPKKDEDAGESTASGQQEQEKAQQEIATADSDKK